MVRKQYRPIDCKLCFRARTRIYDFFFLAKVKKNIPAEDALCECEYCGTKLREWGGNAVLITKVTQSGRSNFNLQAPCVPYVGQAFRYSPENAFYIFNQQIYFII